MRFNNYIDNDEFTYLSEYVTICEAVMLSEMSNETFLEIKGAAKKLGLRVNRSDSLFDYLKDAKKAVIGFFRSAVLYASTDMSNKKMKNDFKKDMKTSLSKISKKEMAAFLLTLDKSTIGLTSHIRHILQGIFGIEITGYYQLHQDHKQNLTNMRKELKTLKKHLEISGSKQDLKIATHFENLINNLESE